MFLTPRQGRGKAGSLQTTGWLPRADTFLPVLQTKSATSPAWWGRSCLPPPLGRLSFSHHGLAGVKTKSQIPPGCGQTEAAAHLHPSLPCWSLQGVDFPAGFPAWDLSKASEQRGAGELGPSGQVQRLDSLWIPLLPPNTGSCTYVATGALFGDGRAKGRGLLRFGELLSGRFRSRRCVGAEDARRDGR